MTSRKLSEIKIFPLNLKDTAGYQETDEKACSKILSPLLKKDHE